MSEKVKKIRVKQADGTMSDYIPIGANAEDVDLKNGKNVEEEFQTIKGNIDGLSSDLNDLDRNVNNKIDTENQKMINAIQNVSIQITNEKSERISSNSNLQNQINAMTKPSGSSVISNEEITNARVAAQSLGSKQYNTLGEGIRGQIDTVNEIIDNLDVCIVPKRTLEVSKILKELYIEDLHDFSVYSVGIYKAWFSSTYNQYLNIVRIWFGPVSENKYVTAFYDKKYNTQEEALASFEEKINNKIITFKNSDVYTDEKEISGSIIINGDLITNGTQKNFLTTDLNDVTNLGYSPKIMASMLKQKEDSKDDIVTELAFTQALENSIGAKNSYQCEDQFKEGTLVRVYQNGAFVYPNKYDLYKQGKIVFKEDVDYNPSDILFEYEKNTKTLHTFKNDLSEDVAGFGLAKESGYTPEELYTFVNDPAGGNRKVLKCFGNEKKASKFRVQFNYRVYATEFTDSIKMYVPQELLDAFIAYNGTIDWFGFGGAWCPFGGKVDSVTDMYSGQGNGFDLKKTKGSNKVYYYIKNRFKAYDTTTGKEVYTVLSQATSNFEVKGNEWITIKREMKVGNPGYCRMTVIDSEGTHVLKTSYQGIEDIAYLGVADPENEIIRYGNKMAKTIPYREFTEINLMKIYTSNEILQHCIDMNGECALYFKDYEINGKNVNAF